MGAEYVGRGKADGLIVGRTSGNGAKIGFYGTTPVALQTASTAVATTVTTSQGAGTIYGFTSSAQAEALFTAVNSLIANSATYGLDM